jgi:hypothetical protein
MMEVSLLTPNIKKIPNWHPCEERDDIKTDQDVNRLDLESV